MDKHILHIPVMAFVLAGLVAVLVSIPLLFTGLLLHRQLHRIEAKQDIMMRENKTILGPSEASVSGTILPKTQKESSSGGKTK